ncbi:MAG: leucyl aminopeptidase [Gammaproteobacteria bacterium]
MIFNAIKAQEFSHLASDSLRLIYCLAQGLEQQFKALKSGSKMLKITEQQRFKAKAGQMLKIHLEGENYLLVGLGPKEKITSLSLKDSFKKSFQEISNLNFKQVFTQFTAPESKVNLSLQGRLLVETAHDAIYKFKAFCKEKPQALALKKVLVLAENKADQTAIQTGLDQGMALAAGMNFMKDLANMPPNICNPAYVVKKAKEFSNQHKKLSIKILNQKDLERLGMGAILAVGQGSVNPPYLVVLEYNLNKNSTKKQAPLVLVGKGITYDTGGNSLKPASSMPNMKYDMSGSAAVLGLMKAAAQAKLDVSIIGVLALAENMPGGSAARPDDVIKTYAGLSVEILNTDAEGRLVLCDALAYVQDQYKAYNPQAYIDIATLTGACVVALGRVASGLFSNQDKFAAKLYESGLNSGDKCWQLPLWDDYQEFLNTNIADMANIGGPDAGSITAACFLQRFIKEGNVWAHLDVAGTAYKPDGRTRQSTARPMPLLFDYLLELQN